MKRFLFLISLPLQAYMPTQTDMQTMLFRAGQQWGTLLSDVSIKSEPFAGNEGCKNKTSLVATTNYIKNEITLNSTCESRHWNKKMWQVIVTHEYGHALIKLDSHSSNKHSVMYKFVNKRQKVTAEDKKWAFENRSERPTILRGQSE